MNTFAAGAEGKEPAHAWDQCMDCHAGGPIEARNGAPTIRIALTSLEALQATRHRRHTPVGSATIHTQLLPESATIRSSFMSHRQSAGLVQAGIGGGSTDTARLHFSAHSHSVSFSFKMRAPQV